MITSSAIQFEHRRIGNSIDSEGAVTTGETVLTTLPDILIKSISCDKQCEKIYYPYGNQSSIYYPTGMIGPVIKIIGYTDDMTTWRTVFTNDILRVKAFGFPTWNTILDIDTDWWLDVKSLDTGPGHVKDGKIHFSISLDMYKRTVV
jgi:hypothetical protein